MVMVNLFIELWTFPITIPCIWIAHSQWPGHNPLLQHSKHEPSVEPFRYTRGPPEEHIELLKDAFH